MYKYIKEDYTVHSKINRPYTSKKCKLAFIFYVFGSKKYLIGCHTLNNCLKIINSFIIIKIFILSIKALFIVYTGIALNERLMIKKWLMIYKIWNN